MNTTSIQLLLLGVTVVAAFHSPLASRTTSSALFAYNDPNAGGFQGVQLTSQGRPVETRIEEWRVGNHAPLQVNAYSMDGAERPVRVMTGDGTPHSVAIRNTGPLEFPMEDYSSFRSGVGTIQGNSLRTYSMGYQQSFDNNNNWSMMQNQGREIQGEGSVASYNVPPNVEQVQIFIGSEGYDVNAKIEVLQGPNCVKQEFEVYSENGRMKPFLAIIDTPGDRGHSIRIENTGPMTYPIRADVQPISFRNPNDQYSAQQMQNYPGMPEQGTPFPFRQRQAKWQESQSPQQRQPSWQQSRRPVAVTLQQGQQQRFSGILPDPAQQQGGHEMFRSGQNQRVLPSYMRQQPQPLLPESNTVPFPNQQWSPETQVTSNEYY